MYFPNTGFPSISQQICQFCWTWICLNKSFPLQKYVWTLEEASMFKLQGKFLFKVTEQLVFYWNKTSLEKLNGSHWDSCIWSVERHCSFHAHLGNPCYCDTTFLPFPLVVSEDVLGRLSFPTDFHRHRLHQTTTFKMHISNSILRNLHLFHRINPLRQKDTISSSRTFKINF